MIFGEMPDGSAVYRHRIEGGGLVAHVMSFGAVLQDLRLDGHEPPLVLGFEIFEPYLSDTSFFGAIVGRCANRINNGQFEIDNMGFQVDRNFENRHHLHGGSNGVGMRNWTVTNVQSDRISLQIELSDGEMGYPGNMIVRCTYACLENGVLDIQIEAETDAPTVCNFAHHSYWNLDGGVNTDDHLMQVDADRTTAVDEGFIPSGELIDVTGSRYDFRTERPIHDDIFIDHNLVVSDEQCAIRKIGSLHSMKSNVAMELRTTEPGLQVYDAFKMSVEPLGLDGRKYGSNAGVALEPQNWPDAINHAGFPNAVLRPGETYRQHTQFAISKG